MSDTDGILTQYRQSDPETRLSLFLWHRELRPTFGDIDAEEARRARSAASATGTRAATQKSGFGTLRRLLRV